MGVDQIPTKTDGATAGEIGRAVIDRPVPFKVDPRYDVPAEVFERLKDAVIANATAIGTTAAPAAGSLEERVTSVESGALLWKWNGADVSQFDTGNPLTYDDSVGGAASGTAVLSVVSNGYRDQPVLRLDATTVRGGYMVPLKTAEITLPARYQIRAHIVQIETASMSAIVGAFGGDDGNSQWRGHLLRRIGGGSQIDSAVTTDNQPTSGQTIRSPSNVDASADTWSTTLESRGGLVLEIDVWRQDGDDSGGAWLTRYEARESGSIDVGELCREDCTSFADTDPDWSLEDLTLFALGLDSDSQARSGAVDFLDLRILTHPMDR